MQDSKPIKRKVILSLSKYASIMIAIAIFSSCKKDIIQKKVIDNTIYEVNPVTLYANNGEKVKQKTSIQYISILYTDLFHQSISSTALNDLGELTLSIGDKSIANDLILQKALTVSGIDIPTDNEMRNDVTQFVADTYLKFYLRHPTPYEAYYMKKLIEDDLNLTPEMVYASFALSNEYLFY